MVIKDSRGKVVAATVQMVLYKGNVDCMEAEVVNFDIQVAQNANFMPMIIEPDSKEVVDLSCNRKGSITIIFWTVATIQASLNGVHPTCSERFQYYCSWFSKESIRL